MKLARVGDFTTHWGESALWDEQRQRLYFVDTLGMAIHWLDAGSDVPTTFATPEMPSGMVLDQHGRIVVTGESGLCLFDPDRGDWSRLTAYPERLGAGARCNDMCADLAGNLITGKLNLGPAEGSAWWYQPTTDTWRLLDHDIANTNGPTVAELDGKLTLVIGDSSAHYWAYDYDPSGEVGPRRMFGDVTGMGPDGSNGVPDGATLDDAGGLWCALPRSAKLVRFTGNGLDRAIDLPFENPTDVTFGGPGLDRLYVTAINEGLYVIEEVGRGRVEPRTVVP